MIIRGGGMILVDVAKVVIKGECLVFCIEIGALPAIVFC